MDVALSQEFDPSYDVALAVAEWLQNRLDYVDELTDEQIEDELSEYADQLIDEEDSPDSILLACLVSALLSAGLINFDLMRDCANQYEIDDESEE